MTGLWGVEARIRRAAVSHTLVLLLGGAGFGPAAWAGTFSLGDWADAEYKVVLGYGLAMRTQKASQALINGPVDPLQSVPPNPDPATNNGDPDPKFHRTGLPTTINFDDGDRNFHQGSLINNRLTVFGELNLTHDNYGLVFSGDGFYDQIYNQRNDNDSCDFDNSENSTCPNSTINKTGKHNHFTSSAHRFDGRRIRLLDAYGYANWSFGGAASEGFGGGLFNLELRVGNQLAAWGESLFFSGIALAQGPADATKSVVPGAEVKEILLPVNQVSFNLGIGNKVSFLGQYKLHYKPDELFPVGDFFSFSDIVGPGAEFGYGSINPANGNGCPGLFNTPGGDFSFICSQNGLGGPALSAPPNILLERGPDIRPSNFGQWGTGLKYQLTTVTNLGLYFLRYHDTTPAVNLNTGFASFSNTFPLTTQIFNEPVPVSYNIKYFDGIHLLGSSFSTVLFGINFAGEFNYRTRLDMPVLTMIAGVPAPIYQRGKLGQALISGLYTVNPDFIVDTFTIVGETGLVHVFSVNPLKDPEPGIEPVGNGDTLFFDRNATGFEVLTISTKRDIFPGWDLNVPMSYSMIPHGNPSMAGAFGALFGQGDKRYSIGVGFQYLQNLEFDLGYNFFFGDPKKRVSDSFLPRNPLTDRDYATFSIKYSF